MIQNFEQTKGAIRNLPSLCKPPNVPHPQPKRALTVSPGTRPPTCAFLLAVASVVEWAAPPSAKNVARLT